MSSPSQYRVDIQTARSGVETAHSAQDLRLRKHADYQRVYQATRKQFSVSMTWFLAARAQNAGKLPSGLTPPANFQSTCDAMVEAYDGPRVGLTVGKVIGKAHERNRIKRRMRELVRKHAPELPKGVDLILHPRRQVMTMDFVKLDAEILRIFRQVAAQAQASFPVAAQPIRREKPGAGESLEASKA